MNRLFIIFAFLTLAVGAHAQDDSMRIEAGINLGQVASFSSYARLTLGANILVKGFYLDYLSSSPEHRYSPASDTKWNDHKALCINAGYQFPILKWLRVMPLVGYAQTNDGITDASKTYWEYDEYSSGTDYHPYKVTPGSRLHYFNYGGGLSIQPCKWFSINAVATRHAIYGGIGINLLALAQRGE